MLTSPAASDNLHMGRTRVGSPWEVCKSLCKSRHELILPMHSRWVCCSAGTSNLVWPLAVQQICLAAGISIFSRGISTLAF